MAQRILKDVPLRPSEITPEEVYLSRRKFMQAAGLAAVGAALAACAPAPASPTPAVPAAAPAGSGAALPALKASADELGNSLTEAAAVTGYNNYYEFSEDKRAVAQLAQRFQPLPWQVSVDGLVGNPLTLGFEDLLKKFPQEERVYRMRCVEGWSMVIPWIGFPLAGLLKLAEPSSGAKYVAFETVTRPDEMPGQNSPYYPWPYLEGLRLDEALHSLTILSTGLYGKFLEPQNGAPLRLVVPWKYGFKSIKSVVRITLTAEQPKTFWNSIAPDEYGFYSNVNPAKDHPRWTQKTERRIGESGRIATLPFNGYAGQVADLYKGMDLNVNY